MGVPDDAPICNFQGLLLSETFPHGEWIILHVYNQYVFKMFPCLNNRLWLIVFFLNLKMYML